MRQPVADYAVNPELDALLDEVCVALQITDTQYREAEQKYRAVGAWLSAPGSPLADLRPEIYPQGSMALQTTVKPRGREEYDLDLVLQVVPTSRRPMDLYNMVRDRLAAHAEYASKLEPKRRCLRLNYARQFHLDVLPARADALRGGTCIEVPDRELLSWKPSNPKGYVAWFERQCSRLEEFVTREQAPLPGNSPSPSKSVLKRLVQLVKRHRDVVFRRDEEAPRSVVLTTLVARNYDGDRSLAGALGAGLDAVAREIEAARPSRIVVVNPTNASERFCEAWTDETYREFVRFVTAFQARMRALLALRGLPRIADELNVLFGEEVSTRAVKAYAEKLSEARESGRLRVTAAGLTTAPTVGRPIPRHTFYGS